MRGNSNIAVIHNLVCGSYAGEEMARGIQRKYVVAHKVASASSIRRKRSGMFEVVIRERVHAQRVTGQQKRCGIRRRQSHGGQQFKTIRQYVGILRAEQRQRDDVARRYGNVMSHRFVYASRGINVTSRTCHAAIRSLSPSFA